MIVGSSAVARDVSEHRRAFEAAQRMAAIIEDSQDAIFGRTLEGIVSSWNPAAERMFGYSSDEIIGKSIGLLIPEDRIEEITAVLAKVKAGQHVDQFTTRRVREDGTVFPVLVTVSPIRDADGGIVGASVIVRDLTEQEHAAQYARSLIEASLDPLMTISDDGKINDVNEATVKVTGVGRDKLIGTDFSQYFTEPDKANEGYQQVFQQGSVTDYPLTARHQDGTLTDLLCNASVYRDTGGNVLGILATGHIVTKDLRHREIA